MKFALIALVSSTAAMKISAAAGESSFCAEITPAESDWVFDYYDTNKSGTIDTNQVKQAIGKANPYVSQELLNKMIIDASDAPNGGMICDGLDQGRAPLHPKNINMVTGRNATSLADCRSKCAGISWCKAFSFRQSDKYCEGTTGYAGPCG